MNVIALAAKPGAGSSHVAKTIRHFPGATTLSFGDFLRKRGKGRTDLQEFGRLFLEEHGAEYFVDMLLGERRLGDFTAIIIDGVRHESVWSAIQLRFPGSQLCCMDTRLITLENAIAAREKIAVPESLRIIEHPVEREFSLLMADAHHVVRQPTIDQLFDSTLRELIAIIDPGIVPRDLRARMQAGTVSTASERRNSRTDSLLSDALSKGRREVFNLLLTEGGCIDTAEMAVSLKISPQEVESMERAHRLLAVRRPEGTLDFPVWQIFGSAVLTGLPDVLAALSEHNNLAKVRFFLNGNLHLGGASPLVALREGRTAEVLRAARIYLSQSSA